MGSNVKPNRKVHSIGEISGIVAPIADEMGIERIYLFGSYARGEATPGSDVDMVVESERIDSYLGIGRLYVRLNRALKRMWTSFPAMRAIRSWTPSATRWCSYMVHEN